MDMIWKKEFFISYITEIFIKLLILLVFIFGVFISIPLLLMGKISYFKDNILNLLNNSKNKWRALNKRVWSDRAAFMWFIKQEQYEKERE